MEKKIYECEFCEKSFTSAIGLGIHKRRMHGITAKSRKEAELKWKHRWGSYHCPLPFCDRSFLSKASRSQHIRNSHKIYNKLRKVFVRYKKVNTEKVWKK